MTLTSGDSGVVARCPASPPGAPGTKAFCCPWLPKKGAEAAAASFISCFRCCPSSSASTTTTTTGIIISPVQSSPLQPSQAASRPTNQRDPVRPSVKSSIACPTACPGPATRTLGPPPPPCHPPPGPSLRPATGPGFKLAAPRQGGSDAGHGGARGGSGGSPGPGLASWLPGTCLPCHGRQAPGRPPVPLGVPIMTPPGTRHCPIQHKLQTRDSAS